MATWRNWAGEQHCAPHAIERPRSEAELIDVVGRAADQGLGVRAVGSGHSFTDAACTDGVMVSLDRMGAVLEADPSSGLVRVQGGIVLRDLALALAARGLALENQGDIDAQTISGAVSTATHGTGTGFVNLSGQLAGVRLVTAAGEAVELTGDDDPQAFRAARVSVGSLGVISELTVRCVPAFRIRRIDEPQPLAEVLGALEELADGHDHFEFFAFPYTDTALTLTSTRTDEPARPRDRYAAWIEEELVYNGVFGALTRLGRVFPALVPSLNRLVTRMSSGSEQLDSSHRIYAHDRRVRFTEMEYAIPSQAARVAIERVMDLVERRSLPVGFPIEVRFVAPDDALLSPSHERPTCYIAVHMVAGVEFESLFRAVEEIMREYGGRPHWGKRHYRTAADLAPAYPEWEAFQSVRARFDPTGVFTNDYAERVLGPVRA